MRIDDQVSVSAISGELGDRIAAARLSLNLTQAALAEEAGVSKRTVERLESGDGGTRLTGFLRVCRVLGLMDRVNLLLPEPTISPIAQLKLDRQQRKRASGSRLKMKEKPGTWTWGESI